MKPLLLFVCVNLILYGSQATAAVTEDGIRISLRARLALEGISCDPWGVPESERCNYVRSHCSDLTGLVNFLDIHFCSLPHLPWASMLLQLGWILLMFTVLQVACERFFCPSIERISEALKLSPALAGVTLLSFGNGAPDVFTQLSMASGGVSPDDGVELALTEPVGSGLVAITIVVALVIMVTPRSVVTLQKGLFLKDAIFYMTGVMGVLVLLLNGSANRVQVLCLGGLYVLYVAVTLAMTSKDEPMHSDPLHHEIPVFRTTSFRDHPSRILAQQRWKQRQKLTWRDRLRQHCFGSGDPPSGSGGSRMTDNGDDLRMALIIEEDWDETGDQMHEEALIISDVHDLVSEGGSEGAEICPPPTDPKGHWGGLNPDEAAVESPAGCSGAVLCAAGQRTAGKTVGVATGEITDGETTDGTHGAPHATTTCPSETPSEYAAAPNLPSDAGVSRNVSVSTGLSLPGSHSLATATAAMWNMLYIIIKVLISFTLPLVSNRKGSGAVYPKLYAAILPIVMPLLLAMHLFHFDPASADWVDDLGLRLRLGFCLFMSLLVVVFYPREGKLSGWPLNVCTLMAFLGSMTWMDLAADEVVGVTVALGTIFNFDRSLLAVTLVSWGNAVSDLTSNLAMARDGFPTMALTACFASPLFTLLGGLACTLYSAGGQDGRGGGAVALPRGVAIQALYVTTLAITLVWLLVIPLWFKFHVTRWTSLLGFTMYATFVTVYAICTYFDG